ncbi:uncharacterized protein LOC143184436 [Calliopsis andreniformis]|uniref:uncharacterized protein LOC143184436 n=1 Tax=Calliopsis andreniformis TaxID=337506 RepID=UPI003FCE48B3
MRENFDYERCPVARIKLQTADSCFIALQEKAGGERNEKTALISSLSTVVVWQPRNSASAFPKALRPARGNAEERQGTGWRVAGCGLGSARNRYILLFEYLPRRQT